MKLVIIDLVSKNKLYGSVDRHQPFEVSRPVLFDDQTRFISKCEIQIPLKGKKESSVIVELDKEVPSYLRLETKPIIMTSSNGKSTANPT